MAPACPKCNGLLPAFLFNTGNLEHCPSCGGQVLATVFPAILRGVQRGHTGERILIEGESSCFYHEQKKAVVPCDHCGRFLCAVCDVELSGRHLCPACLELGRKEGKLHELENYRLLYDGSALLLALLPLALPFLWMLTVATAPIAIVLAIMSWFKPGSLVRRSRLTAILAICLSVLELGGWAVLLTMMFNEGG